MSRMQRATKMETGDITKSETSRESVEVAEAIKALQVQLADLGEVQFDQARLDPALRYLLVCAHGNRSLAAAVQLRAGHLEHVWSLRGGLATALRTQNAN